MFTTEDQQFFYDFNIDAITDDYENSSVHTRHQDAGNVDLIILDKFIRIDGIRYAFRHLIKGYRDPSVGALSMNQSTRIPLLNIERTSFRFDRNEQENEANNYGQDNNAMFDEESISSLEENNIPSIIEEIKMREYEQDLKFKQNFGFHFEIPSNFIFKQNIAKLDLEYLYESNLPGEKELIKQHFVGWYPNMYLDHLKRPDKALVKKYANPDQISSTGREQTPSPHVRFNKS